MKDKELKPCPFCGGDAWIDQYMSGRFVVGCNNGCVVMPSEDSSFTSEDEAIKAWNHRAFKDTDNIGQKITAII